MKWEPCPRCHSSRVKINGKTEQFVTGLAVLLVGAPGIALVSSLLLGAAALVVGALIAMLGLLIMLSAPIVAPSGQCRDCNQTWTISPSELTARPR